MNDYREKFDIRRFIAILFGSLSMLFGLSFLGCVLSKTMWDWFSNFPDFLIEFLDSYAPPLGVILGIISVILGAIAQWKNKNGKAAIILGVIGTVACLRSCWYILIIIGIARMKALG